MKLSESTVNLLKNFSSINQSILFKEGTKLRTISVMKNILVEANVGEEFPKDFGIYDLNQFLNGLSLHQSPELDFKNDEFVVIREGKRRSKFFFADPSVIVAPPEKEITLPSEDVTFVLKAEDLQQLKKAASIYQVPDVSVMVNLVWSNWLHETRRMTPQMTLRLLLVRLMMSLCSTSKKRTLRSSLVTMT